MDSNRVKINWLAGQLGTLPSSIRIAAQQAGLRLDGDFLIWVSERERNFIRHLAALPSTPAEKLRYDLGLKARRLSDAI